MDDLELINLASKASGFEYTANDNPLVSDALALRLAVKLGMQMYTWQPNDGIGLHYTEINRRIKESHNDDPYAATRRAIVRAAAEIGKESK